MSISKELYPSQEDLPYEEEILRNPFSLKLWWRYLIAKSEAPFSNRFIIYERICENALKLLEIYPLLTPKEKLITRTRRTFDRALCALPVTQHDRIWEPYLVFVSQKGIPIETSLRVYRRYLKYDPSHIEDFIEFLVNSSLWQEAAERLASVLNDDTFYSIKGKTKHRLWLELCDLLTTHKTEVSGLSVDAIIRGGIRKFTDEVGRLWTSLADYYIRRSLFEKARDIFEEGMTTVVTVRDFSVIFDAYSQFEESVIAHKMESLDLSDEEEEDIQEDTIEEDEDIRLDVGLCKSKHKFERKIFKGFWLHDDKDIDLRLARLEYLMNRRPALANGVLLRSNPHNVEQWHRRYFEDAFKVYERGVKIFKYPHVKDIWVTYLSKFVKRYGKSKLERARELFEHAVETAPADAVKQLYLQYAKLEEDYGLAKRAMKVYDEATKAVPNEEKLSMYEIHIARAAEIFGVPKTREIYEQAIESGLPDKDVKTMCLKYAELEKSLGEIDRAREIYVFASQFADPRTDGDFWNKWHEFEVQHGHEDTFREMLRIKRSVSASYSQTHFILPEYMMQKDQSLALDDAKDQLKQAGVPEDEMAALERQLAPASKNVNSKDSSRKVGFVSAGVESQTDGGMKPVATEDIDLAEESDSEDEKVEIAQKDVPSAVFGGLVRKRDDGDRDGDDDIVPAKDWESENRLGALERIKRQKKT
ncbi:hypothetical protein SLEP1_g42723 [Rubroshorea leprosula]|uniref:Pre-mRNA-splicing factor SYF1 n=1 Tax=Rubroshorea leprosula TaxID=152421 RepID=A0AAV5LC90_9ROSI|nr:hypothetical protein SLEP1_g42723 [Rubroshorea leprosula]